MPHRSTRTSRRLAALERRCQRKHDGTIKPEVRHRGWAYAAQRPGLEGVSRFAAIRAGGYYDQASPAEGTACLMRVTRVASNLDLGSLVPRHASSQLLWLNADSGRPNRLFEVIQVRPQLLTALDAFSRNGDHESIAVRHRVATETAFGRSRIRGRAHFLQGGPPSHLAAATGRS